MDKFVIDKDAEKEAMEKYKRRERRRRNI